MYTVESVPHVEPCYANLYKWGLSASELCSCGRQTMNHIVDSCQLMKLEDALKDLVL